MGKPLLSEEEKAFLRAICAPSRGSKRGCEEGNTRGTDASETAASETAAPKTDAPKTDAPKTDKAVHERAKPYGSACRTVPNNTLEVIVKYAGGILLILSVFSMIIFTCALVKAVVVGTVVYPCYSLESKFIDANAHNLISGKGVSVYEGNPSTLQVFINYAAQIICSVLYYISWVASYIGVFLYYLTRGFGLPFVTFIGPLADVLCMILWIYVISSSLSVLIMTKYIPITSHSYPGRKLEESNIYLYFVGIFVYFFFFWHHPLATNCHVRAIVFWGILDGMAFSLVLHYLKEYFGVTSREDHRKNKILEDELKAKIQAVEVAKNFIENSENVLPKATVSWFWTSSDNTYQPNPTNDSESPNTSTKSASTRNLTDVVITTISAFYQVASNTLSGIECARVKRSHEYVATDIQATRCAVIETSFVAQQVKYELDKGSVGYDECKAWIRLLNTCESHIEAVQKPPSDQLNQSAVQVVDTYMEAKVRWRYTEAVFQEIIACLRIRMHLLSLKESAAIDRKDVATHFHYTAVHFTRNEPTELRENKRRKLG
jgi:hypothetical protein